MMSGMQVTLIGTGFVGVVSAAVFASFGNTVYGLDIDEKKVQSLQHGKVPFFEPGLEELLKTVLQSGNLKFTTDYTEAIPDSDVVIIAVGTPSAPDGNADLTYVKKAAESLAPHLKEGAVVAIKSTVPPGTLEVIRPIIEKFATHDFVMASLPEFLREGSAVEDTLHPDRVVVGCDDATGLETLRKLHEPFQAPIIEVSPESAQMGKYAANAYLATRITFINQIADLCEKNGADVQEVVKIIGEDKRIGTHYWYPGFGYGGSCFPKDVRELAAYSRTIGYGGNLFNKITELNEDRIFEKLDQYEKQVSGWSGKRVAVLGLAFKPHTDDMREAPSTKIIPHLLNKGASVVGYDPMATEVAKQVFANQAELTYANTIEEAIAEADVVLAVIEWPEIVTFDFTTVENPTVFIDVRNQFDPALLAGAGWTYIGVGRKEPVHA